MEITINHVNNLIYNNLYLRIIPCRIDFVFSFFNHQNIEITRINIGIFDDDSTIYIDLGNYKDFVGAIPSLDVLQNYLHNKKEYVIYKLFFSTDIMDVEFDDDSSLLCSFKSIPLEKQKKIIVDDIVNLIENSTEFDQ
ncbi:MAG: hypothetical protein IJQ89_00070 [Bacteroidales bacterium]|nr:hypothetical protein [Bacteroidales bacterium]